MSGNKHFDCLKNTLPDNWVNSNATGYYNRAFWKRCKCEYGTSNPCKETADKWNPVATEPSKWTKGCSPASDYYDTDPQFLYTYNSEDCGSCHSRPCRCRRKCGCDGDRRKSPCDICRKCNGCDDSDDEDDCGCSPLKSYLYNVHGGECQDVAIVYRMIDEEMDCDNIVELKIPVGGSKEVYLARHFSPEFVESNRFQCASVPCFNSYPNNVVDNMRQEEFTESDQRALTQRGIKNALYAKELIKDGKLSYNSYTYSQPSNAATNNNYYYFGGGHSNGVNTGLTSHDSRRGLFPSNF